ncbi:hypothetical protein QJQ45_020185 [Haematococcus lacustris]|nr:hypothetical protein QJQ45_020185 [Haematococcus lacustris]
MQHRAVFAACIVCLSVIAAVYVWKCTPPARPATSINQNPAIPSRHLPTPAPAVPSPKPSYEIADSPEVLAQLFGRNDAAFKPAPVPADTLFPIQPGHPHRPHWATVLATTMLSISDSYALPTTTSIVWCHYQPDSPSSLPSLLRNFRHNRRTNVFFIPKTMPVNTNSVYYAALTVPSAMGCPEMPLVVVEDDVAFASNFYNHLSNLHKSALALQQAAARSSNSSGQQRAAAGSSGQQQAAAGSSGQQQAAAGSSGQQRAAAGSSRQQRAAAGSSGQQRAAAGSSGQQRAAAGSSGQQRARAGSTEQQRAAAGTSRQHRAAAGSNRQQRAVTGSSGQQRAEKGNSRQSIMDESEAMRTYTPRRSRGVYGRGDEDESIRFPANVSIVQHTGGASAVFNDKDGKSTRFHMAEDFSVALGLASEDPEGTW